MNICISSFRSEWLKTRRSAASWLVIAGGLFIPAFIACVQLIKPMQISTRAFGAAYWDQIFIVAWEPAVALLLPFGLILVTSLVVQLEFRNNAWKQVCVSPQSLLTVFASKFMVVLFMLLQFFVLFNVGLLLVPYLTAFLRPDLPYPPPEIPWMKMLQMSWGFYISSLPVVALQFWIGLRFPNFLVSIGAGLSMVFLSLFLFKWEYGFWVPYTHNFYTFLEFIQRRSIMGEHRIAFLSLGYFLIISVFSMMDFKHRISRA